jgi:hypothetical protein
MPKKKIKKIEKKEENVAVDTPEKEPVVSEEETEEKPSAPKSTGEKPVELITLSDFLETIKSSAIKGAFKVWYQLQEKGNMLQRDALETWKQKLDQCMKKEIKS